MILTINGCSIDDIVDDFEQIASDSEWNDLCYNYSLFICEDLVNLNSKSPEATIEDIIAYDFGTYVYTAEKTDEYDYLGIHPGSPIYGDCDDFAITFTENNLREGNFRLGQVKIVFGTLDGDYHM